jgi:hypothetical protein
MVVGVVYLGSIPWTVRSYYRLKRAAQTRRADMAQKPEIVPLPGPGTAPVGETNTPAGDWLH